MNKDNSNKLKASDFFQDCKIIYYNNVWDKDNKKFVAKFHLYLGNMSDTHLAKSEERTFDKNHSKTFDNLCKAGKRIIRSDGKLVTALKQTNNILYKQEKYKSISRPMDGQSSTIVYYILEYLFTKLNNEMKIGGKAIKDVQRNSEATMDMDRNDPSKRSLILNFIGDLWNDINNKKNPKPGYQRPEYITDDLYQFLKKVGGPDIENVIHAQCSISSIIGIGTKTGLQSAIGLGSSYWDYWYEIQANDKYRESRELNTFLAKPEHQTNGHGVYLIDSYEFFKQFYPNFAKENLAGLEEFEQARIAKKNPTTAQTSNIQKIQVQPQPQQPQTATQQQPTAPIMVSKPTPSVLNPIEEIEKTHTINIDDDQESKIDEDEFYDALENLDDLDNPNHEEKEETPKQKISENSSTTITTNTADNTTKIDDKDTKKQENNVKEEKQEQNSEQLKKNVEELKFNLSVLETVIYLILYLYIASKFKEYDRSNEIKYVKDLDQSQWVKNLGDEKIRMRREKSFNYHSEKKNVDKEIHCSKTVAKVLFNWEITTLAKQINIEL